MDAAVLRSILVAAAVLVSSFSPPHKTSPSPSFCPLIDCPPCTLSCSCPPLPDVSCPEVRWEDRSSPLALAVILGLVLLAFLLGWQCRQASSVVVGRPVRAANEVTAPEVREVCGKPQVADDLAHAARTQVASFKKELGF
jgi:hypothetical protein